MTATEEPKRGEADADPRVSLGDFIATQRRAAEMSLRQLAERAGISNPYVSQIERGLRQPSVEVLQSLARALQVSATTLYTHAGISPDDDSRPTSVVGAIRNDPGLTEAQRQALLEVYHAFTGTSPHQPGSPRPTQA